MNEKTIFRQFDTVYHRSIIQQKLFRFELKRRRKRDRRKQFIKDVIFISTWFPFWFCVWIVTIDFIMKNF